MNIRDHIRKSIHEGLPAEFTQVAGQSGILFEDENQFIAFDDLNYNDTYGYFQISQLPDIQRDCTNENPETIHWGADYSDWKPLLWADGGGNLALLGDVWNAADLYQALKSFFEHGTVDPEVISENDPAWDYMKRIDWAIQEYRDYFSNDTRRDDEIANTIRAAADRKAIHGSSRDEKGNWYFRPAAFRGWLIKSRDEKRGRPRKEASNPIGVNRVFL